MSEILITFHLRDGSTFRGLIIDSEKDKIIHTWEMHSGNSAVVMNITMQSISMFNGELSDINWRLKPYDIMAISTEVLPDGAEEIIVSATSDKVH